MSTQTILPIFQVIIGVLLIGSVLLQQRGSGLSGVFGGDSAVYRTKRGAEKTIFNATIILSILFLVLGLVEIFV